MAEENKKDIKKGSMDWNSKEEAVEWLNGNEEFEEIPMEPITDEVRDRIYKRFNVEIDAPIHNDVLNQLKEDSQTEIPINDNFLINEVFTRGPEKVMEHLKNNREGAINGGNQCTAEQIENHLYTEENLKKARIDGIKRDLEDARIQVAGYNDVGQEIPKWLNKKIDKLVERIGEEDEN